MFKVGYIASSRADYGIVRNYLKLLNSSKDIELNILLTGAILDEKYGSGYHIIEDDGFKVSYQLKLDLDSTDNKSIIKNMAVVLEKFGEYFFNNKFDLIIILGDRYEMLGVATAAAMYGINILHIHGGEITLGNYDEFIRHSITKMSKFHFTSTEEYRKRVIQLGEDPKRVYNIGAMGAENCKIINEKNVISDVLQLENKKYFVVLFHPETLTDSKPQKQIKILLQVIRKYINNYKFVFIGSNADTGSNEIREELEKFILDNENTYYFKNIHPDSYHFLLKNSIALIGNSSSGIIEAPSLGCYTINIGDRQKGRVRGKSVIDVECNTKKIDEAISKCLNNKLNNEEINPYYKGNSSEEAYTITKKILNSNNKNDIKEFYDINY